MAVAPTPAEPKPEASGIYGYVNDQMEGGGGSFSSLLGSSPDGQFAKLLMDGLSPNLVSGSNEDGLIRNPTAEEFESNFLSVNHQANNQIENGGGESSCCNHGDNGWPDLSIYTPGSGSHKEAMEVEVALTLISVHPAQDSAAVAVGSELHVFNLQDGCPVTLGADSNEASHHKESIRAIRCGANGKIFVSAGDDKVVKIWATDSWHCLYSVPTEKKVSAVAISENGQYVCYADKFGVVWVVELDELHEAQTPVQKKGSPLLAHYCSIITSLEFSPDGQFIVTADRNFKIRVTVFPKKPIDGAHEIQSYCLGHTEFVSCLAFVYNQEFPQGYLVSGSGDSTVRLWDFASGLLLHTLEVGSEQQTNGTKNNHFYAVTDLCATPDGSSIFVVVQGLPGILMLSCNLFTKTLSVSRVVSINGEDFIPTSLGTSSTSDFLWMVMGVSSLPGFASSSLARVRVISGLKESKSEDGNVVILEDKQVPCGEKVLEKSETYDR